MKSENFQSNGESVVTENLNQIIRGVLYEQT